MKIIWPTSRKELNKLGIVLAASPKKGKYWTIDDDTHTLIVGTTRSGKSRRIILPTIWHLSKKGESMVICDLKKELYPATKNFLHRRGYKTVVLDLRTPQAGNRFNILHPVITAVENGDIAAAIQAADDIAYILSHVPNYRGDPIWPSTKRALISALLLAVAIEAPSETKHMGTAYHLLSRLGAEDGVALDTYFTSLSDTHPARIPYGVFQMSQGKMRASIATDTLTSLQIFAVDPAVQYMLAAQDHSLSSVGEEKTAVFLVIPDERANRNILASIYINQCYSALVDLANANNRRLPIRVNFLLDEFGNIPAITDFPTKITTAGGRGIRFTLAVQDLEQLATTYPNQDQTISGQCWTWIYILTNSMETAKVISDKCGRYTVRTEQYSSSAQRYGETQGVSQGLTGRNLIMPDELLKFPKDQVLILRTRENPAKLPLPDISKYPIYQDFNFDPVVEDRPPFTSPPLWLPEVEQVEEEEPREQEQDLFT